MEAIEDQCNECIRSSIPMVPHWYHTESEELKKVNMHVLLCVCACVFMCVYTHIIMCVYACECPKVCFNINVQVRSRGLPDNFTGNEVRVVEIEGV